MKTEFEIQLFADFTDDDDEQSTDEEFEESEEQQATDDEAGSSSEAEDKPEIPPELEGLDETYARAAMKEWKEQQQQSEQTEQLKQEQVPQVPQVDELTQLRQERDQLKAQLQQYQNVAVQQAQAQMQLPPAPKLEITPEIIAKFKETVDTVAMQMTGFSKEDVAGFEFRDDGEEKQERWNYAKQLAQTKVLSEIQHAQEQYVRYQQQILQQHQQSIQSYNEFVEQEMQEADHQQIAQYAINDFFGKLNPIDQLTIRAAYDRVEKQTASPADVLLVKNYYTQAKLAYRGSTPTKTAPKEKQLPNLPKVDRMNGTTNPTGDSISVKDLEKLIETGDFKHIPKKYRDYYKNSTAMFDI